MEIVKIARFKDPADYTPADYFQIQRTGERPLNPEWIEKRAEAVAEALAFAGLEDDADVTDLGEMNDEQILSYVQNRHGQFEGGLTHAPQPKTVSLREE
jgi:hypothetical protein